MHIDLIKVVYLCYLYLVNVTLHFMNDSNGIKSTQKLLLVIIIIASLKSEPIGKLINKIPG